MKKWAIIVAGGKGLRMGSDIPKQFLKIAGKPIIALTIEKFLQMDQHIQVIVVTPQDHRELWDQIQSAHFPHESIVRVNGGKTRFESVRNGLDTIHEEGIVAIHDAVRPYVTAEIIMNCYDSAEKQGSGVAAVPLKDSIREIAHHKNVSRSRADFRLVQTPQTFRLSEIKDAFAQAPHTDFTDDASVYEAAGYDVKLIEGSYENSKITTPGDLR